MTTTAEITEVVRKKIKDLPPLPLVVQKLVRTLDDENSSAEDVMKVLSSDQALASKVLKLVNSSFYGLSGEISTPSRAVVILGFAAIRNLAVGLGVARFMALSKGNVHQQAFWDHSIAVAAACRVAASRTGYPDAEEAFIAGLLHDIGQMVLGIAVPEEYAKVLAGGPQDLLANEEKLVGLGHAKAGQMLLKHWKLPRTLTTAVRFHHNPEVFCAGDDPLVSLVALADTLASVHGAIYERSVTSAEFMGVIKATGLDPADAGEVLAELGTRIEETRVFLQIAADEEIAATVSNHTVPSHAVIICTDEAKLAWARSVLEFYGTSVVPVKDFFGLPDAECDVEVVMLDPDSVSSEQLQKMKPRLDSTRIPVLLFDGEGAKDAQQILGSNLQLIPLSFSRADLMPTS